jgi:hypothetical protein
VYKRQIITTTIITIIIIVIIIIINIVIIFIIIINIGAVAPWGVSSPLFGSPPAISQFTPVMLRM